MMVKVRMFDARIEYFYGKLFENGGFGSRGNYGTNCIAAEWGGRPFEACAGLFKQADPQRISFAGGDDDDDGDDDIDIDVYKFD